ncbi:unnamed protein product [Toxocara canis]|uniref:Proteoglycan 4-like n=1 Tax=Toxocara canis TaxID=6265 RepID=A0A183UU73_TOXCA|nr:unnamed protein product [Toxocara canis]
MIEEYDANTEDSQDGNESATQKLLESSDVSQESTFSPLADSSITVPSGGSEMPVLADISDQSSTSSSLMETPVSDSSVLTTQSPQAAKSEPSARPQSSTEPVPVTEPNVLVAPQPTAEPLPSEELPFPFAEPSSVSEIVEELIPFLEQPSVIEQMPELLNISAIGPEFIPFSDPEPLEEPEAEPSNFTEPFTISEPEPAVALTPTDEPPLVTQPEPTPEISIPAETEPSEEPAAELEPALSSDTGPEPEQAFEPEPTGEPQPPVSNSSMEPLVKSTSTASQAIQPDAVTSVVAEPPVEMSPTSPSSVEGEGSSTTEQQTEMSTPAQSPKQPENNSACHISVLIPLCLTFFTALLLNAPK